MNESTTAARCLCDHSEEVHNGERCLSSLTGSDHLPCGCPGFQERASYERLEAGRDEAVALYDKLEADERLTLAHVRGALLDGLRERDAYSRLLRQAGKALRDADHGKSREEYERHSDSHFAFPCGLCDFLADLDKLEEAL